MHEIRCPSCRMRLWLYQGMAHDVYAFRTTDWRGTTASRALCTTTSWTRAGDRSRTPELATLCANVLDLWPALWSFTEHADVEATNNRAERAIRHAVLRRKTSTGTQTPDGDRFVKRILSIRETCRCQNQPMHPYLVDVHSVGGGEAASASAGSTGDAETSTGARATAGDSTPAVARGVHVVQRGESLWRIAEQRLGTGASDAKIAALVDELWRVNADKIKTGDPDLIYPGQQLRMAGS